MQGQLFLSFADNPVFMKETDLHEVVVEKQNISYQGQAV